MARSSVLQAVLPVGALAWVLANPTVTAPIIGVTKLQQLQDAIESMSLELSDQNKQKLEEPYQPHAVAGV